MRQRHRTIRLSDGSIVLDVFGADSGDENEDIDDDDLDDDESDEGDDDDESNDDDSKDKAKKSRKQYETELAEAEAKADKEHRRMVRADRAKSKAVNELNALKTGSAKDLADALAKVTVLEAQLAASAGTDPTAIIREAFNDDETYSWNNRKLAYSLLDLDEIDIDDKGKMDAASFKDAVKQVATDHAYLVKVVPANNTDDGDDENDEQVEKPKRSGAPAASRQQSNTSKNRQVLEKKFPQLANRF